MKLTKQERNMVLAALRLSQWHMEAGSLEAISPVSVHCGHLQDVFDDELYREGGQS